jgi:GNAT superfamily N-acetyltransferase
MLVSCAAEVLMTKTVPNPPSSIDAYLPQIFEWEAKAYLSDLLSLPTMALHCFSLSEEQSNDAIVSVSRIFEEMHSRGELQVAGMPYDGELLAYALVFSVPGETELAVYLHKIFVLPQYRRNGIGSALMEGLLGSFQQVALLCPPDKVAFYQSVGFNPVEYERPHDANFMLSHDLYAELVLMTNYGSEGSAPFFRLNDVDLSRALGLRG